MKTERVRSFAALQLAQSTTSDSTADRSTGPGSMRRLNASGSISIGTGVVRAVGVALIVVASASVVGDSGGIGLLLETLLLHRGRSNHGADNLLDLAAASEVLGICFGGALVGALVVVRTAHGIGVLVGVAVVVLAVVCTVVCAVVCALVMMLVVFMAGYSSAI